MMQLIGLHRPVFVQYYGSGHESAVAPKNKWIFKICNFVREDYRAGLGNNNKENAHFIMNPYQVSESSDEGHSNEDTDKFKLMWGGTLQKQVDTFLNNMHQHENKACNRRNALTRRQPPTKIANRKRKVQMNPFIKQPEAKKRKQMGN